MKKRILFIAFAMSLTAVLSSCGNKNDRAISKYEKLIKKANETTNPVKKVELSGEAYKVIQSIKEDELTDKQKERLTKINMEAIEHAADGIESMKKELESEDFDF